MVNIMKGPVQGKVKGLSGSALKWIAIVTMLIDHIGAILVNESLGKKMVDLYNITDPDKINKIYELIPEIYMAMRMIGRLAFPIFCFLLVQGFIHTRNVKTYAIRLGIFALISEIPFDLALHNTPFYWKYSNVFFTLLCGLLVMIGLEAVDKKIQIQKVQKLFVKIAVVGIGMLVATILHTDYSWIGVLCITLLYITRNNKRDQIIMGCAGFSFEIAALLAFIPIGFYNGKRGMNMKYFFYAFYPVHLFILYLITLYI